MSTVHITIGTSANGKACGAGDYEIGSLATLFATPDSGCSFTQWNDGVTLNPRTVKVTENATYTASFNGSTPASNVIRYNAATAVTGSWVTNNTDTSRNTYDSVTGNGVLYLNEGVTIIGNNQDYGSLYYSPFYNKSDLVSVDLTDSGLETIDQHTFSGCTNLISVSIPSSATYIAMYLTFKGCTALASITVDPNNATFSDGNGSDCIIQLWSTYYDLLSYGCKNTVIPSNANVGVIHNSAFENCTGLTSINIPNSVFTIGENAFKGCTGLTSVTISSDLPLLHILANAFKGCTGLTSITIPMEGGEIGDYAFQGCTGLTSVTITGYVDEIGAGAFNGCSSLASVTCYATYPPSLENDSFDAPISTLYVPAASVSAYQADASWSAAFTTITSI